MIKSVLAFIVVTVIAFQRAQAVADASQRSFASPEEAMTALVDAARRDDLKALETLFGPEGKEIITSGDPVRDNTGRETFTHLFDEKHALEHANETKAVILIGPEEWPFPVPIAKSAGKWIFDTLEGREEILNRRIGRNELDAISICRLYVQAQKDYYSMNPEGKGVKEYAQLVVSSRDKKDGLFWPRRRGEPQSPLGPLVATAVAEGYSPEASASPRPFHGYLFRILKEQGKRAPGGKKSYITEGGRMTGGFALVAYPATWGISGIMTFIVGESGKVYQKNFGPNTESEASSLKAYDPGPEWEFVP